MAQEKAAMRAYVTGSDHLQYTQLAKGTVQLNATHSNLKQYVMELRIDLHTSIAEVKRKLYTHNGTSIAHMELHLRDQEGTFVCKMLDDARPLGFYGVSNGMEIHVVDTDPFSLSRDGGLDDVSKIEKYRMSEEEYEKRENTLRAYKKKMLAEDPTFRFLPENRKPGGVAPDFLDAECVAGAAVGQRCEVSPGARRGTIMYIGDSVASLNAGYWVGVKLDLPLGKGDGSRGGVKYFDADDKHGVFVRPDLVAVGAFPTLEEEMGLAELGIGADAEAGAGGLASSAAGAGAGASVDVSVPSPTGCATPSGAAAAAAASAGGHGGCSGCGHDRGAAAPAASGSGAPLSTASASAVASKPSVAAKASVAMKARRRGQAEDDDDNDDEL
jgi:tubulin-folding cofactor B